MKIKSIVSVFFLLLLTSSVSQADCQESPQNLPGSWGARQAVEFAKKNNPDSAIALKRIEEARASLSEIQAANFPSINISSEYGQTDNPMYSFGNILNQGDFDTSIDFNDPGRTDNLQFKTSVNYQLYNGGKTKAAVSAASTQIQRAQIELESIQHSLSFEVVKTFQAIIQAENMVVVRQQAIDAIDAAYEVGVARFEAGDLLRQEVLNLELQQATANENLIQAQHSLDLIRRTFLNLLGLDKCPVVINSSERIDQSVPENINFDNRHELRLLNNAEEIATAELARAKSSLYPTVDAFASYRYDYGFESDGDGDSWMAGIRLNYLLYDGNQRSSQVKKAQINLQKIQAMKRKLRLALNLDIQQAQLDLEQALKRLAVTRKMVGVAEEVARLSRARFKEGLLLSSDLIDFETRLSDAQSRYLSADTNHRVAVANVRRAAGLDQFPEN
jgi:outer membrane protein